MPTTAPVQPGTISKKMLSFEYGTSSPPNRLPSSGTTVSSNNEEQWICGEAIAAGDAVTSPDPDGKVWKATTLSSDNKEAYAIAKDSYAAEILGAFQTGKKIRNTSYDFTPNKTVWLVDDTPNVTTVIPTFTNGHLIQELGKSVSVTEFIIDIEEAEHVIL